MKFMAGGKRTARRLAIAALAYTNLGDSTIRHHYTNDRLRLHLFKHKGYWYHGRRREKHAMAIFKTAIEPGHHVIEVGGHIGYISMYFAHLVGPSGSVHVFEPGLNNLPYIRNNLEDIAHARLIEKAAGAEPGVLVMYLEDLTGQNNSMVPDFEGLKANQAYAIPANVTEQSVEVTTIDNHVVQSGVKPNFVKIDVEGYEPEVLAGARQTLELHRPKIMVEVQTQHTFIGDLLAEFDYKLYSESAEEIQAIPPGTVNVFAVPQEQVHEFKRAVAGATAAGQ
jgi:FkbM family methyltransferase